MLSGLGPVNIFTQQHKCSLISPFPPNDAIWHHETFSFMMSHPAMSLGDRTCLTKRVVDRSVVEFGGVQNSKRQKLMHSDVASTLFDKRTYHSLGMED